MPDTLTVQVESLSKTFHDESRGLVQAVKALTFSCVAGEIFGLLGPNGAGKTTTLRMLATLIKPTGGSARVLGHDVALEEEAVRRSIGFYSSSTALYPRLTARETIDFFARINGMDKRAAKARTEAIIERFGMGEFCNARVETLSTGMKQKVSIARTVAHDPPVLIFDEPTASLDVLNAHEIQQAIQEFRAEGKTILFSTHIMSEAERICDRIGIVQRGELLACDTIEALRAQTGLRYLEDIFMHFAHPTLAPRADEAASQR